MSAVFYLAASIVQLAHGEGLPRGTDFNLLGGKGVQKIGVLQIDLVGAGQFPDALRARIQQVENPGVAQMPEIFHHRVTARADRLRQFTGIQLIRHSGRDYPDERLDFPQICDINPAEQRKLHVYDKIHHLAYLDIIVRGVFAVERIISIFQIFVEQHQRPASGIHFGAQAGVVGQYGLQAASPEVKTLVEPQEFPERQTVHGIPYAPPRQIRIRIQNMKQRRTAQYNLELGIELVYFLYLTAPSVIFVHLVKHQPASSSGHEPFGEFNDRMSREIYRIQGAIEDRPVVRLEIQLHILAHQSGLPHTPGPDYGDQPGIPSYVLHGLADNVHGRLSDILVMSSEQSLHIRI